MLSDALSHAAYRVSLCGPGAELDGDVQSANSPSGPARLAPSTVPARVKEGID